jgi:formylmethanofuran dehydrogenase subunit E
LRQQKSEPKEMKFFSIHDLIRAGITTMEAVQKASIVAIKRCDGLIETAKDLFAANQVYSPYEWQNHLEKMVIAQGPENLWYYMFITEPVGGFKPVPKNAGYTCSNKKCNEYVMHSEPNMPDGTFKCYRCRKNPY